MSALFFAPAGPVITTSSGVHDISVVRDTLAPAREHGIPRTRTLVASMDAIRRRTRSYQLRGPTKPGARLL